MARTYDNWERLVAATLKRELFLQLAFAHSRESSFSSLQSDIFFDPASQYSNISNIPFSSGDSSLPALLGGDVFNGWIDEDTLTAIKPYSGFTPKGVQNHEEWVTYVNYLTQLHHTNLVKLFGYCSHADNRLLLYEFMPRGSLYDHLFSRRFAPLSWATRIKVAIGARGLCFLHEGEEQVMHGDFKPSNILLDEGFNAKLFAFSLDRAGPECSRIAVYHEVPMSILNYHAKSSGLRNYMHDDAIYHDVPIGQSCAAPKHMTRMKVAIGEARGLSFLHEAEEQGLFNAKLSDFRFAKQGETYITTEVMGTYGYAAPEYIATGNLSVKCDVYGFGVVLLELLSGRRAFDRETSSNGRNRTWVTKENCSGLWTLN